MTDNNRQPTVTLLIKRGITRREMLLTTGGAVAGILLAGCGGAREQAQEGAQEEQGAKPVAGSFVGEIPGVEGDVPNPAAVVDDNDAFVAVVAADPKQGEDAREVGAYLCSGATINEWFWGSAAGNNLDLTSDGGARLEGKLTRDAATGTITLDEGDPFAFDAARVTGLAGLYTVSVLPDGRVSGSSENGGRLEGQVEEAENTPVLTATVTAPDGETLDFRAATPATEPDDYRLVVLPDGRVKGGKTKGTGAGFFIWSPP